MQQDDNSNDDLRDKGTTYQEDKSEDMEDWRNEHGNPSNKFLQGLADRGNIEKLRAIAEDLDAEFGPNDSVDDLIGAIRMAIDNNPNTTT